ncbi:hypothetical protein ACVWZ6_001669 [Bradyrhizobium sp. GM6.1]
MKRRAAVEPVIGHLKAEHRMSRNHLKGRARDRINPVLAAAGFNFHLLLRWFELQTFNRGEVALQPLQPAARAIQLKPTSAP